MEALAEFLPGDLEKGRAAGAGYRPSENNSHSERKQPVKQKIRTYRSRLIKGFILILALLGLLLVSAKPLTKLSDKYFLIGLLQIVVFWLLITGIMSWVVSVVDYLHQQRTLKELDLTATPEEVKAASVIHWPSENLYVWDDHLLNLGDPMVLGVDLRKVRSLSAYFSETSSYGLLVSWQRGHLPVLIYRIDTKRFPGYKGELKSFLDQISQIYPQIRIGPEKIPCPDLTIWKDIKFVTSTKVLLGVVFFSSILPSTGDQPIVSLILTLPAVWFWFRRFRLYRSIKRNGRFILEMGLFLATLMLQGILRFQGLYELTAWVLLPIAVWIWVSNFWLKSVLLPPLKD